MRESTTSNEALNSENMSSSLRIDIPKDDDEDVAEDNGENAAPKQKRVLFDALLPKQQSKSKSVLDAKQEQEKHLQAKTLAQSIAQTAGDTVVTKPSTGYYSTFVKKPMKDPKSIFSRRGVKKSASNEVMAEKLNGADRSGGVDEQVEMTETDFAKFTSVGLSSMVLSF
jgi:hypothetical protein